MRHQSWHPIALRVAAGALAALAALAAANATGPSGWTTYHGDAARDGAATVAAGARAHLAWRSSALDGEVYAEPLWAGNRVYVATENDTVYALSRATGRVVWRRHVGTPVPLSALPCGDIDPLGITGTPVIARGRLYAVAEVAPGRHLLVTLDASTGRMLARRFVDPAKSHSVYEQERGALTVEGDTVYVPLGGLAGDCGPYVGYVVGARKGAPLFWYRVPAARQAGIWATAGASEDPRGNLYVATGNGSSSTAFDHGDSVIRLSPALKEEGYFAPSDWAELNASDLDLGSTAPALLPGGLAVIAGKAGVTYLLRQAHLGGIGGQIAQARACEGAYGADAVAAGRVYLGCLNGIAALSVRFGSRPRLSVAWHGPAVDSGPPVVAGDVVWTVDISDHALYALSASSGRLLQTLPLGAAVHFETPSLAPGMLIVGAGAHVDAFRLRA